VLAIFSLEPCSELDKFTIVQTCHALSISITKRINIDEERRLLIFDFINDVVSGNYSDEHYTVNRGLALGFNIGHLRSVMLMDLHTFNTQNVHSNGSSLFFVQTKCKEFVESIINQLSPTSVSACINGKVIILFIEDIPQESALRKMQHLGKTLITEIGEKFGVAVTVGIGSSCQTIYDIRQSYESSINCISISNQFFETPCCVNYYDYPILSLLIQVLSNRKEQTVLSDIDSLLRPLRAYDHQTDGQLEATFRLLLRYDMDTGAVAKNMFLHKNTVLQRKKKITTLYSNDPFSHTNRLQFEVAFMLESLFEKSNSNNQQRDYSKAP
jgi:purine catabolism regulator